ncbi:unknown [Firmicutes bacterium CAG:449]|nr:unknown [Firmicutes bacterium CAG:449]
MKKWIKKYLILTLCFAIAVFPTFVILTQFDVLKDNRKYIFLGVVLGLLIIYYLVMSYFMFRKKGDKK